MWKNIIQLNKKVYINQALIYIIKQGFNFRAANMPAKYESKVINKSGHCWVRAYFNKKWHVGETTVNIAINFDKCSWTKDTYLKPKADEGTYIDSYKFSIKNVLFNSMFHNLVENHLFESIWYSYYVLRGHSNSTHFTT